MVTLRRPEVVDEEMDSGCEPSSVKRLFIMRITGLIRCWKLIDENLSYCKNPKTLILISFSALLLST